MRGQFGPHELDRPPEPEPSDEYKAEIAARISAVRAEKMAAPVPESPRERLREKAMHNVVCPGCGRRSRIGRCYRCNPRIDGR